MEGNGTGCGNKRSQDSVLVVDTFTFMINLVCSPGK